MILLWLDYLQVNNFIFLPTLQLQIITCPVYGKILQRRTQKHQQTAASVANTRGHRPPFILRSRSRCAKTLNNILFFIANTYGERARTLLFAV